MHLIADKSTPALCPLPFFYSPESWRRIATGKQPTGHPQPTKSCPLYVPGTAAAKRATKSANTAVQSPRDAIVTVKFNSATTKPGPRCRRRRMKVSGEPYSVWSILLCDDEVHWRVAPRFWPISDHLFCSDRRRSSCMCDFHGAIINTVWRGEEHCERNVSDVLDEGMFA